MGIVINVDMNIDMVMFHLVLFFSENYGNNLALAHLYTYVRMCIYVQTGLCVVDMRR